MKNLLVQGKCIFLAVIVLLLYGCPYESEVPLGQSANSNIDTALVGNWQSKIADQSESGFVSISPFNEKELLIVIWEEGKSRRDLYRAYTSSVGDQKFLNIQEIKAANEKRSWMFAAYSINGEELTIKIVEDKIFKDKNIASSTALNDFIKANLNSKDLYGGDNGTSMRLSRKKD